MSIINLNEIFLWFELQFLQQDIPLFEGIISDLFPGVVLPKPDYGALETEINKHADNLNLQAIPWFVEKIIQVWIQTHGVFAQPNCESNVLICHSTKKKCSHHTEYLTTLIDILCNLFGVSIAFGVGIEPSKEQSEWSFLNKTSGYFQTKKRVIPNIF